ncbi:MAG: DUF2007 domain-containing protein [Chloroflexi bacterium]|nr:DUF2007 domain-containing protein [Chloroflexota bacterium]
MSIEPVVVYTSQGPLEAEVALSKLRSEGIPAYPRYEAIGRTLGLTIDGLGLVEVLVAPEDEVRAREILEALPEDSGEDWSLPDEAEGDSEEDEEEEQG